MSSKESGKAEAKNEPSAAPVSTAPDAQNKLSDNTNQSAASAVLADQDGKVPVSSEPPPLKATKPAPGMSATSGPLEDFPEGTK